MAELRNTFLPPETPDNMVVSPTMNRWEGENAPLPNMVHSVQHALSREGLSDDTWMVLGDATEGNGIDALRLQQLSRLEDVRRPSRLFLLTPENQQLVAKLVAIRTGIRQEIVDAILKDTGYASQRIKLDAVIAGNVAASGRRTNVLTLDDDTVIPLEYGMVREPHLPQGLTHKPNSQVLMRDEEVDASILDFRRNRIGAFFESLGMTVGEMRRSNPSLRATQMQRDTMHEMLERASSGMPAQFEVTHDDSPDMDGSDDARIVAAAATKFGIPDYRTVKIAQANYADGLPDREVPIQSLISGPNNPFAYQQTRTNVDSAALARLFDGGTITMPWWFVSSDSISRSNPLKTVTGHYRADNELLPVLLAQMSRSQQDLMMYLGGIDTQVLHNRARSGYRPNLHEQVTASLVGNVAALEAADRLSLDSNGSAYIEKVDDGYTVPEEKARKVFEEMRTLADICEDRMRSFDGVSYNHPAEEQKRVTKVKRYHEALQSIRGKMANFNFDTFRKHMSAEVRDQMRFYGEVLNAFGDVVREVQGLIEQGQYPVQEYVTSNISHSVRPLRYNTVPDQLQAQVSYATTVAA